MAVGAVWGVVLLLTPPIIGAQRPGPTPRTQAATTAQPAPAATLAPTAHPPFPRGLGEAWLVPGPDAPPPPAALQQFASGVRAYEAGNYGQSLLLVSDPRLDTTPLAGYATYYTALCYLRLARPTEARAMLDALRARAPAGYLAEAAPLAEAEAALASGDAPAAVRVLDELSTRKTAAPEVVLDLLVKAASAAGDTPRATSAAMRLYYEYPASSQAAALESDMERLRSEAGPERAREFAPNELRRAERLFAAKKYAEAQVSFERLRAVASGDEAELVGLRLAECNYFQGHGRQALEGLAPYVNEASRQAEARFFELSALRALGRHDEFVARVLQLAADHPTSTWAADALNALASHYIRQDEEEEAAGVFRTIVAQHPKTRHAERAAWKLGWWHYRKGEYAQAADVFEQAAARAPRADPRPAWLYWAGRARDRANDRPSANARFELVTADYLHSYYGRLAATILEARGLEPGRRLPPRTSERAVLGHGGTPGDGTGGTAVAQAAPPPSNADVVRALLSVELLDLAAEELRYAQRTSAASPVIDATLAWTIARQGDLRRGINLMKQAYPQYLAADGDELPAEVRRVIFPLQYWDLIRRHATARGLDPYLVAALVAQESTFDAAAHSGANAWGLMQIIPSTGRRLARAEGVRRFRTPMLTDPQLNVRLGTRYFSDLVKRFGAAHLALASYNAGEHRVVRWQEERPGLDRDEFIDDIPFPETQNYVKRILGTAEDYRRLYPAGSPAASAASTAPGAAPKPAATAKAPAKTPAKKSTTKKKH
jgi:soluble lytic murein transglycosylase